MFAAAVRYARSEHGLTPVFFLHQPPLGRRRRRSSGRCLEETPCILRQPLSTELTLGLMSRMQAVISMRLHGLIFAAGQGVPLVGVVYDPKVSAFLSYMGQELYEDLSRLSTESLCAKLDQALALGADPTAHERGRGASAPYRTTQFRYDAQAFAGALNCAQQPGDRTLAPGCFCVSFDKEDFMKAPHMHPFVQLIKEDIPMVFRIFARDIRNLWRRPVALIIVLGVAFIPSLYAWINIYANWDPYGNTGNLRVAVASKDAGYQVEGVSVNMGERVIESLHGDENFDWQFTNEAEARDGVESGKYYAAVIIPASFTEDIVTFITDNTERPAIEYYSNEKKNAIAAKSPPPVWVRCAADQ